jgi:hypothetical protein
MVLAKIGEDAAHPVLPVAHHVDEFRVGKRLIQIRIQNGPGRVLGGVHLVRDRLGSLPQGLDIEIGTGREGPERIVAGDAIPQLR